MLILEDIGVQNDIVKKILSKIKQNFTSDNFRFDENIEDYNFWCNEDKDRTVFIQAKDGSCYATICKQDIDNEPETDILESIKYQLDNTID